MRKSRCCACRCHRCSRLRGRRLPRSVDRLPLQVTHDPTQSLEYHVRLGLTKGTELWQLILDAIREHAEDLVRKLLQQLMQLPATVDQALDELYALLPDWVTELPDKIVAFINANAGINLGSWNAFLASLSDGKGIDLPALPKIVAALDGIPWQSGDPGAILRAILSAGVQLVRGVIPPWMLPPIHVGRITSELPSLVADGGFDATPPRESGGPGEWFHDASRGSSEPGCAGIEADGEYHELVGRPVAVAAGQKYRIGMFPACESATGAADCVQLLVVEYGAGDEPVNTHVVVSWTPSGTQEFGAEAFAEYTVPEGVQMAGVSVAVTEGFTSGAVFIDDVTGPSVGLLQMSWTENLIQRWEQLAKLFGIVDTDLDGDVDLVDVWNTLWATVLKPLNWIPTVAQDIIDRIINAFENLGQLVDVNLPGAGVLEAVFGIFNTGLGASARSAALEARIRQLESAANTIILDFNGSSSGSLGGDYDSTFSGGGGGQMGRDGRGNVVWKASGAGNRTQIARYNVGTLGVDNGIIHAILASSPQSYIFDDAYTYLCWRMNAARTSYMRLRMGFSEVRLQAVVSGSVANLGAPWSGSPRGGNEIQIQFGDAVEPRWFNVKIGGTEIVDTTDTADVSMVGPDYRGVGVGMETGNRLVFFQNIPAGLSVVTAAEVL